MISQIIGSESTTKEVNVPGKNILLYMTEDFAMRNSIDTPINSEWTYDEDGCRDKKVTVPYIRVNHNLVSYKDGANSSRNTIVFPTVEAFEKFREFIAQAEVIMPEGTQVN